jgi:hypothetical protein
MSNYSTSMVLFLEHHSPVSDDSDIDYVSAL